MNEVSPIGHNNPPADPLDDVIAPFSDFIEEAENWLDGEKVTTEAQLKEVDRIAKGVRSAKTATTAGKKVALEPLNAVVATERKRWDVVIADLQLQQDGLGKITAEYRKKLADEKEAARKAAWEAAQKAEREAAAKIAAAEKAEGDIEAARLAEAAKIDEMKAKKAAAASQRDKVTGFRTVAHHEVEDLRAAHAWIVKHDREALNDFIREYARKSKNRAQITGVREWTEKVPA